MDYTKFLTECAIPVNVTDVRLLSEASKIQVTDDVLNGMLRFITDKYNAMDFGEIEKSAGDILKFKYRGVIMENTSILATIYKDSDDPGAEKYREVITAVRDVMNHLQGSREPYSQLYKSGNGMVQLIYTSLVAACIYSIGTLISNTIRFVTTEQDTECQVLYDEIPGTIKHVHIKNILAARASLKDINEYLYRQYNTKAGKIMEESVTLASAIVAVATTGFIISCIPKIIVIIREIIYSVYLNRVKVSEMLGVQVDLINTNIESLERGRGNKKVIVKQRKIADKLTKWQNRFAVKLDTTNSMVSIQKEKENRALRVDRDSPIVQDPGSFDAGALML